MSEGSGRRDKMGGDRADGSSILARSKDTDNEKVVLLINVMSEETDHSDSLSPCAMQARSNWPPFGQGTWE